MSRIMFLPIARSLTLFVLLCVTASACASQTPAPTPLPSPEITVTASKPPATRATAPPVPPVTSIATATQAATIPVPTATSTPVSWSTPPRCPVVLFARERDLWRTNLYGDVAEQLTEGELLDWQPGTDDWWVTALSTPVQISPDGRWLTFFRERIRVLVDVTARAAIGMPMPHALIGDWSPDSRYFAYGTDEGLYLYDVQKNRTNRWVDPPMLDREAGVNVREVVWSPDGRFIGFACCFTPLSEEAAASVGQVWKLEVATGQMETVGEIKAYVAMDNPLCWTAEGQLVAAEELAERGQGARCSKWGLSAFPLIAPASPDGTKYAYLGPSSPDDPFWTGPSLLTVSEAATGEVLWQREISGTIRYITWSPDGQYLLLDDDLDRSPIWRIYSDGTGDLELLIEDGFLLGVIPQWCEPSTDNSAGGP